MFENVFADLMNIEGVNGVLIVGKDGLLIEHLLNDKSVDPEAVGAMVSTVYGSGKTVAGEVLKTDDVDMVSIETPRGKIIAIEAGDDAILGLVANNTVNLGLIRVYLKRAAEKVAKML